MVNSKQEHRCGCRVVPAKLDQGAFFVSNKQQRVARIWMNRLQTHSYACVLVSTIKPIKPVFVYEQTVHATLSTPLLGSVVNHNPRPTADCTCLCPPHYGRKRVEMEMEPMRDSFIGGAVPVYFVSPLCSHHPVSISRSPPLLQLLSSRVHQLQLQLHPTLARFPHSAIAHPFCPITPVTPPSQHLRLGLPATPKRVEPLLTGIGPCDSQKDQK